MFGEWEGRVGGDWVWYVGWRGGLVGVDGRDILGDRIDMLVWMDVI